MLLLRARTGNEPNSNNKSREAETFGPTNRPIGASQQQVVAGPAPLAAEPGPQFLTFGEHPFEQPAEGPLHHRQVASNCPPAAYQPPSQDYYQLEAAGCRRPAAANYNQMSPCPASSCMSADHLAELEAGGPAKHSLQALPAAPTVGYHHPGEQYGQQQQHRQQVAYEAAVYEII